MAQQSTALAPTSGRDARGIRLPFTILGIPLLLDWSFLLILPLLAFLIGTNAPSYAQMFGIESSAELAEPVTRYTIGLIAALGLFICVVLHELGHAVTARLYGVHVQSITLWFLGGMAHLTEMPRRRGGEAVVAIVGPVVSFALGGLLFLLWRLVPDTAPGVSFVVAYLATLNIFLGAFNLLPALPLDGGRVLRSLLALGMPHLRATRIAAVVSKAIAVLLGITGLLSQNLFLVFIAFFIYLAVQGETQHSRIVEMLDGLRVRHLMTRDVKAVPPTLTVAELTRLMLDEHHLGFPVIENGQPIGMVTLRELASTKADALVGEVMIPDPPTAVEDEPALDAFSRLTQSSLGRMIVVDGSGNLVGIVTTGDIMRAIKIRTVGLDWGLQPGRRPARDHGRGILRHA
jgi:Zn-dependent protease